MDNENKNEVELQRNEIQESGDMIKVICCFHFLIRILFQEKNFEDKKDNEGESDAEEKNQTQEEETYDNESGTGIDTGGNIFIDL